MYYLSINFLLQVFLIDFLGLLSTMRMRTQFRQLTNVRKMKDVQ